MTREPKPLYLRLIERVEVSASDEDRLRNLEVAVNNLALVQWAWPPKIDPKGGFTAHFRVPKGANLAEFAQRLEESGYWVVF